MSDFLEIIGQEVINIVSEGMQGPPGIAVESATTATSIEAFRVVAINQAGQLVHATNADSSHAIRIVGITTRAFSQGHIASWKSRGECVNPAWSMDDSLPVFLGVDGELTQTPPQAPQAAFSVTTGFAISPTSLFFNPTDPILLSS